MTASSQAASFCGFRVTGQKISKPAQEDCYVLSSVLLTLNVHGAQGNPQAKLAAVTSYIAQCLHFIYL